MTTQPMPGLEAYEPDWSQAATAAVDLRTWAQRVAKRRGVPEDVLLGVLNHESGLNPKAWGNGGGVGQFIDTTARQYGTTQAELRQNPHKAVDLAAQLLRDNANMLGGDYDKAAAAYFIGAGNIQKAVRLGGANWLPAADRIAAQYNQGTVSSYLSKVHGGLAASSGASEPSAAGAPGLAMLGDTGMSSGGSASGTPSVMDMLADARERRQQELEQLTQVEPLPEIMPPGQDPTVHTPFDTPQNARFNASLLDNFRPGEDYTHQPGYPDKPSLVPFDRGAYEADVPPLQTRMGSGEVPGLSSAASLPGIRPPSVGDAGLAMLGEPVTDQDVGAPTPPPTGAALGSGFGGAFRQLQNPDELRAFNEDKYARETEALRQQYAEANLPQETPAGREDIGLRQEGTLRAQLGEPLPDYGTVPKRPPNTNALRAEIIERTGIDPDTGGAAPRPGGGDVVEAAMQDAEPYGPRYSEVRRYDRLQAALEEWARPPTPAPPVGLAQRPRATRQEITRRDVLAAGAQREPTDREGLRQEIISLSGIDPETGAPPMTGTRHYGPEVPASESVYAEGIPRDTAQAELRAARAGRTDYAPAVQAALTAAPLVATGVSGPVGLALQGEAERVGLPKPLAYGVGAIPFAVPTLEGRAIAQGVGGRASLNPLLERTTTTALRNPSARALLTRAALSAPAQGGAAYLGEKVDTSLGLPQVPGVGGPAAFGAGVAAERGVDIGLERAARGRAPRYTPQRGSPFPERPYDPALQPLVDKAIEDVQNFQPANPGNWTPQEQAEHTRLLNNLDDALDYAGVPQPPGPKKGASYYGARVFYDFSNPVGTAIRLVREAFGQRGALGPAAGVRRAADREREDVQDRRYGERVKADILALRGQRFVDLIDANLARQGQTWAEWADVNRALEPEAPVWQRQPEDVGANQPVSPTGDIDALRTSMRRAVQDVRDERAGGGVRAQMGAAQRRLRGGGGPAAGIIGPSQSGRQNPVQPEDIAFGEPPRDVPEAEVAGMRYVAPERGPTPWSEAAQRDRQLFEGLSDAELQRQHRRLSEAAVTRSTPQERQRAEELASMAQDIMDSRASGGAQVRYSSAATRQGGSELVDRASDIQAYEQRVEAMDGKQLRQESNRLRNALGSRPAGPLKAQAQEQLDAFENVMERRQSGGGPRMRGQGDVGPAAGIISPGRRDAQGRMVGRPEDAQSDRAWTARVNNVMQQALKGAAHRFWYRESASQIMELARGNKQDADVITRMLALSSNQQKVADQGRTILQALNDYKNDRLLMRASNMGQRNEQIAPYLRMSAEDFDNYIIETIGKGESEKVTNFYLDMMDDIDPVRAARLRERSGATATIDQWMNRAFGYKTDSRTPGQYKVMAEAVQHIADELGWLPKEAQAAIWVQTIIDDGKYAKTAATNYRDAVRAHRGLIRQEVMPSPEDSVYEGLAQAASRASDQELAAHALDIHRAKLDADGHNWFAKLTHLPVTPEGEPLVGGAAGGKAGGLVDPVQADAVTDWASLEAAAVGANRASWLRPFDIKAKGQHNAWLIDPGRQVSAADLEALRNELPDLEVIPGGQGGAVAFRVPGPDDYLARRDITKEKIDPEKDSPAVIARKQAHNAEADRLNAESRQMLKDKVAPLNKADRARVDEAVQGVFSDAPKATIDSFAADGRVIEDAQDHAQNGPLGRPDVREAFREVTGRIGAARDDFIGRSSAGAPGPRGAARGAGGGGPAAGIVAPGQGGPGWGHRALNELAAVVSAPVSMKSSLSPPFLRQGLARLVMNPRAAVRELGQSMKSAFSPAEFEKTQNGIRTNPWVQDTSSLRAPTSAGGPTAAQVAQGQHPHKGRTYIDVGGTLLEERPEDALNRLGKDELQTIAARQQLRYGPQDTKDDLVQLLVRNSKPEELAGFTETRVGRAAEAISSLGGRISSNRQAAAELNLHRTNWYAAVAQEMENAGITDVKAYEDLRKTIEQFTQRGTWAQGGRAPVFFSTRAMSGRIQAAWRGVEAVLKNPRDVFLPGGKPGARREAGRAFVGMVGANVTTLIGAYYAADAMGLDPEFETDGKLPTLKIGPHRWDPWAGLNSPARFAAGVVTDTLANPEGGLENAPQAALAGAGRRTQKFVRGGLSPVFGKVADTIQGRDFTGQKYNLAQDVASGNILKDLFAPFIAESLGDAATEGSPLEAAALAGPAFLSTGINSYTTPDDQANTIAQETYGGRKYDDLDDIERLPVLSKLPAEAQTGRYSPKSVASQKYREDLEKAGGGDRLRDATTQRLYPGKTYDQLTPREKEAVGDDKERAKKQAEIYRDSPELDVRRWYFGSQTGGSLNSARAVELALGLDVGDRDVRLAKLDRVLNTPKMKEAWQAESQRVVNFLDDAALAKKYAAEDAPQALRNDPDFKNKTIPPFEQLKPEKQSVVLEYIRREVRADSPKLDAALAYFGYGADGQNKRYSVHSAAASTELKRLRDAYGRDAAKKDYIFWGAY